MTDVVRFTVEVSVLDWEDPGDGRTVEEYAEAALTASGLRDADKLDGFADLRARAWIDMVNPA